MLAGGYCLYASTTLFVLALKEKGTHIFALDPAVGDFVLQRAHVQIPARGACVCVWVGGWTLGR